MRDLHSNLVLGVPLAALLVCCVTVTDDGWSSAERIEEQGDPPGSAQVALDASGTAVVVWHWWGFDVGTIRSRRHTPGAGWGPIEQIDNGERDTIHPALAVDPSGNAVAVWMEAGGGITEIWANRYMVGRGWGTATRIDRDGVGTASDPQVAVDSAGNAVAVWHQSDGNTENIWANRSTPDGGWDIAELIEGDNNGHAGDPRIAMDPEGNAIAVWHQSDGMRANIWANRYTPRSRWDAARLIENNDEDEAKLPDVAMDPDGNATVVWHQSDGTRFDIWSNRYDGTWGDPKRIDADDGGDADRAEVGMDADGHAIAVWKQFDGFAVDIWANRYVPDVGWGTAKRIEANDVGDALRPRLAVSANGDAVVVWLQSDGLRLDVWSSSYTPSEDWSSAAPIDARSADRDREEPRGPAVAIDPNGNAVAVWARELQTSDAGGAISFANEGSIWSARLE